MCAQPSIAGWTCEVDKSGLRLLFLVECTPKRRAPDSPSALYRLARWAVVAPPVTRRRDDDVRRRTCRRSSAVGIGYFPLIPIFLSLHRPGITSFRVPFCPRWVFLIFPTTRDLIQKERIASRRVPLIATVGHALWRWVPPAYWLRVYSTPPLPLNSSPCG